MLSLSLGYKWERQLVCIETLSPAIGFNEVDERQRVPTSITAIRISPYTLSYTCFFHFYINRKVLQKFPVLTF